MVIISEKTFCPSFESVWVDLEKIKIMNKNYIIILFISVFSLHSYSQQTLGLFINSPESLDGYTLFSPQHSKESYLIDNCGEKIHSWSSQYLPGLSSYLLEDGTLLRTGRQFGMGGGIGIVEMLDWNSNVIWSHSVSSTHGRQHHDIELLPNGNILLIVWDNRTNTEVIQAGSSTINSYINSEQIIEIQPDLVNGGAIVVWEWKAWDHLIQDADSTKDNYGIIANYPGRIDINFLNHNSTDWLHFNGVSYNEEFDQIIISVRNFSEFWIIDHSTTISQSADSIGGTYGKGGDILYRWGNPQAYNQGGPSDQKLFLQHHTHWIPENYLDEGRVILFNNQTGSQSNQQYSTVDVLELPVDSNGFYTYTGGAFGPSSFDWTYQAPNPTDFYSNILSGAQRLENGNTLICEGVTGRYFEIDTNETIVWEYVNPVNDLGPQEQGTIITDNQTFRCTRYSPNYSGLSGQTLVPQGNIETGSTFICNLYSSTCSGAMITGLHVTDLIDDRCVLNFDNMNTYDASGNQICRVDQIRIKYREVGTSAWGQKNIASPTGYDANGVCNSSQKTDKLLLGLTLGTEYEWEVKVWYCSGQTTGWAQGPNFTTADECPHGGNYNAYGANPTKATFTWDGSNGAYSFLRIKIRVDSISNPVVSDFVNVGGVGVNYGTFTKDKNGLTPGETYRGQGRTWCNPNGGAYNALAWNSFGVWTQPTNRIDGGESIKNLDIYPNPSNDVFNITFTSEELQDLRVRVLNVIGEELIVEDLQQFVGEYIKQINLKDSSKGIYLLEIETNEGVINKKLILQ